MLRREQFEQSDKVVPGSGVSTVSGRSRMATPAVLQGPLSPARVYKELGWHDNSTHPAGQGPLPGMESLSEGRRTGLVSRTGGGTTLPDTVPVARLHHLSDAEHADVVAHAASFGVTRESAKRAFAANLDQSFDNAHAHGTTPHARDFYVDPASDMPRGHIIEAARSTHASASSIATATAITSPQTEWGPTNEGHYPNIRAARQSALHRDDPANVPHPTVSDDSTKKIGTFTGNVRKGARAVAQQESGTLAADLHHASGASIFGGKQQQKTTAFRNALVDPEGPEASLVSDVHSGGRGFAPHLSPTEAGAYLKHPGIHQWHDDIAREVMHERGLNSVNNTQAAQWGQAQLDSGQVKPSEAYSTPPKLHPEVKGQQALFGEHPDVPRGHAAAQVHIDAAADQTWTMGDQKRHEATVAKRRREGHGVVPDPEAVKAGW
jgi:hypothetical protein